MWRDILRQLKEFDSGQYVLALPKDVFLQLLKKSVGVFRAHNKKNQSGFRKTGIYPLEKQQILKRTQDKTINLDLVGETFLLHLEQMRNDIVKPRNTKRKKLSVPAGQRITENNLLQLQGASLSKA